MPDKEIVNVKKNWKLVAFDEHIQYWVYNGNIYSISADGERMCIWCSEKGLTRHLQILRCRTGKKHFTESDGMTIVDRAFFDDYPYA